MNLIAILEKIVLPTMYFGIYSGLIVVILLIVFRIRQLSIYQHRITRALNPNRDIIENSFKHSYKKLVDVSLKNVHSILKKIEIITPENEKKIALRLQKSGFNHPHKIIIFLLAKVMSSLAFATAFLIINSYVMAPLLSVDQPLLLLLIGLLLGIRWVEIYLDNTIKRYRENIKKALPDALELLMICIEAGYSNENALIKISNEFNELFPEIANEFSITHKELKVMPEKILAWKNFANRTELSEINAIVTAFTQSEKYGTSIVVALKNQIELMRQNRMLKAEEKAAKIPVYLSIPLAVFFLPIIFVIILSPTALRIIELI